MRRYGMTGKSSVRKAVKKRGKVQSRPVVKKSDPVKQNSNQQDLKRQLKIQKALFEIADAASAVKDMGAFYKKLHKIVGGLMYAENFFIALYDEQTGLIAWPYHADVMDTDDASWSPEPLSQFKGGTAYIIRTGKSTWMARDFVRALELGEVETVGTKSVDSIGIPLKDGKNVLGAIVVQSYSAKHTYTEQDEAVLSFVAQHIATALTRARALEAERQRTDELAILNSVGEAMAKTLDVKTVTRIVGDKVRDIFKAEVTEILLLDPITQLIHVPYSYYRLYQEIESFPLGLGITSRVIQSRQPLVLNSLQEQADLGAIGGEQDQTES
ncbi:GAF domain-containing protein [candidate division KSB1 bacterium]|nr:GAF domain-containing protein [candidate division KSB1 bacterium]